MRRTTVVFAAALVTITGTAGIRALRSPTRSASESAVTTKPVSAPRPSTLQDPSTSTTADTSADATPESESPTHAALRFLNLDEQLFPSTSPENARALTESIAASAERGRLGAQAADHQRQILAKGDLGGLKLRIAPIVSRTRDCSEVLCTVDVYFLRLWSFPGQGALDDYATAEIHVVLEDNEWRLQRSSVIDGPYPAGRYTSRPTSAIAAKSFENALVGFTDIEVSL